LSSEDIPEFELNLDNGEQNVNGIFAYRSPQFEFVNGTVNESIEAVVVHKQICDIYDLLGSSKTSKISASLLADGSGILIEEPSLPLFMIDKIDNLYANTFKDEELTKALKQAHSYTATAVVQSVDRRTKKYILRFPDEIRCILGYMNPSNGQKLMPFYNVTTEVLKTETTGSANNFEFTQVLATFVAAIENAERRVLKINNDDNSEIRDLFNRMSF
jgi:hypothetical protein